jgi:diguanylate cyclase (GGDEF)-like protein
VVLLADLDEFTRLCGHVGYDVGDQVLTSLGEGLRRVWRDASEVARVGPDAFAAVFAVDERSGRLIAERTRAAVEASKADIRGQRLRFTATICGISLETLPSNADANQLYAALQRLHVENRRQGGNRTVW